MMYVIEKRYAVGKYVMMFDGRNVTFTQDLDEAKQYQSLADVLEALRGQAYFIGQSSSTEGYYSFAIQRIKTECITAIVEEVE